MVKNPLANAGEVRDVGNPMDRGAWQSIVHGINLRRVGHDLAAKATKGCEALSCLQDCFCLFACLFCSKM